MFVRRFIPEDVRLRRFVGPMLFSLAICYLAFHALNGDRGIYAYLRQSRQLETSQQELAAVMAERISLENRVKLLGVESLDLDLLDEQSRRVLGTVRRGEVVVILDNQG